jgi:hypothetical protein
LYWERENIWGDMFHAMQDIDAEWFPLDGTIILANQCAAGYIPNPVDRQG